MALSSYRDTVCVSREVLKSRHILVGDYTIYSGYYHGKSFNDCVLYLDERDDNTDDIDELIFGKFCSIGGGVKFIMGGNQGHDYHNITTYPIEILCADFPGFDGINEPDSYKKKGNTVIGNDVWIGMESLIMPGVKVGDGAVIAARSVVTKDISPYEIWGGNPAEFIKMRFSQDKVKRLLSQKWWDWPLEKILSNRKMLASSRNLEVF